MNRWSLRNNRLKLETSGGLPVILEEFIEYASNKLKQNWKMSTCKPVGFRITSIFMDYVQNFLATDQCPGRTGI
jgi:hypothetical protein